MKILPTGSKNVRQLEIKSGGSNGMTAIKRCSKILIQYCICSFKTSKSTEIGSIASEWEIKSGGSNRMNDYQEKVLQNVDSIVC